MAGGETMKKFTFKVELTGDGESMEEAWSDAIEGFYLDPGVPGSESTTHEEEEEEA